MLKSRTRSPFIRDGTAAARKYDLTAYDAAYVDLAAREGLPLATLDERMRAAAIKAGVVVFEPNLGLSQQIDLR